jgi:hypothetical protein
MEITIKEVEVHKLQVEPGDVVVVNVKSDDLNEFVMSHLKEQFEILLQPYGAKVAILGMGEKDDLKIDVISENRDNKNISYCSDCNCGKKEAYETGTT